MAYPGLVMEGLLARCRATACELFLAQATPVAQEGQGAQAPFLGGRAGNPYPDTLMPSSGDGESQQERDAQVPRFYPAQVQVGSL
jgi:hypothetical protein